MRIAIAGFQHETNTFAPTVADYEAFRIAKAFPPLVRGQQMLDVVRGKKLPSAGAIGVIEAAGAEVVPILWCQATPSAHVTEDASASKPVIIADTQDNPGGGGPGDTTGLLRAMLAAKAKGAVIGALIDP